jgi:hypothetical protein
MPKHHLLSYLFPLLTIANFISTEPTLVNAQVNNSSRIITLAQQTLTVQEYLQAGYQDLEAQNYQQALLNFTSALKLSPDNKEAQQGIIRTEGYIYDENMEKGYEATNNREYDQALTYFNLAAQQRPDDFYSQQAINNVLKLKQKQSLANSRALSGQNRVLILLIFIFLLLLIIIIALISIARRVAQINESNPKKPWREERKTESISLPQTDYLSFPRVSEASLSESVNQKVQQKLASQPKPQSSIVPQENQEMAVSGDITQRLLLDLKRANPSRRGKIIWQLANQADSRAIEPLVEIMMSANSQDKSLILEALAQIGFNSIKPINQALVIGLQDQHGQVRKNTLRDVTKIYELITQIQPIIAQAALNDPDSEVRAIAKWALTKLSHENNILVGEQESQDYEQEINATIVESDSDSI